VRSSLFWFEGCPFYYKYKQVEEHSVTALLKNMDIYGAFKHYFNDWDNTQLVSHLEIYCFGFSNQPIREFLRKIGEESDANIVKGIAREEMTDIYTPKGTYGTDWNKVMRPSRPMSTIDLETDVKERLVNDVKRFASNERKRWYANLGIP
jgi:hypothetical protein